jgi:hypothetical protein
MYINLHVKYRLYLSDLNKTLIFLNISLRTTQILNFLIIRSVEAEFRADGRTNGRTDMTKTIVSFRNALNAPKSVKW